MIGSYFFAIISSFLLIKNSNLIDGKTYKITIELFFLVIIISTTSQIGDLVVSYFKRLSKIKDTGKKLPDMVDYLIELRLLFNAGCVYNLKFNYFKMKKIAILDLQDLLQNITSYCKSKQKFN